MLQGLQTDVSGPEKKLCQWPDLERLFGVGDVIPQDRHVQGLFLRLFSGPVVEGDQVTPQAAVVSLVLRVKHQEDQVEPETCKMKYTVKNNQHFKQHAEPWYILKSLKPINFKNLFCPL